MPPNRKLPANPFTIIMPITMDTQQQNFWVESIQKEAALRFSWQLRYSKKFAKDISGKQTEQKQKVKKDPAKAFQSNISAQIRRLEGEKKEHEEEKSMTRMSSRKSDKKTPLQDMRPATARTKALLYNGISAHGEGRYAYLKKRKTLIPEHKYEFPVLSSCLYGWKIKDYIEEPQGSPYGRTCVIRDTFYRNSGISLG